VPGAGMHQGRLAIMCWVCWILSPAGDLASIGEGLQDPVVVVVVGGCCESLNQCATGCCHFVRLPYLALSLQAPGVKMQVRSLVRIVMSLM
jgi:hypothetical protein